MRPVTSAELDSLDLPPSALDITPGAVPWWRSELVQPVGPESQPVYDILGDIHGRDAPDWRGPVVEAWDAVYNWQPTDIQ